MRVCREAEVVGIRETVTLEPPLGWATARSMDDLHSVIGIGGFASEEVEDNTLRYDTICSVGVRRDVGPG